MLACACTRTCTSLCCPQQPSFPSLEEPCVARCSLSGGGVDVETPLPHRNTLPEHRPLGIGPSAAGVPLPQHN